MDSESPHFDFLNGADIGSPFRVESLSNACAALANHGISKPRVATILRRWAIADGTVRKLHMYHTGQRFCLAAIIDCPTVSRIRDTNQQIRQLLLSELNGVSELDVYVVGQDHSDAQMFHQFGAISIIDTTGETIAHVA